MNGIYGLGPQLPLQKPSPTNPVEKSAGSFGDMISTMISNANEAQIKSGESIRNLHSGKAEHLHEVMLAVEEADVSMRMLVQIRNRALTAYEEIMRMQI
jgi:flagellar hook-basal body complex protein FliE